NLAEGDRNYTTKDSYMVADVDTNYLPAELKPVSCAFNGNTNFYNANLAAGSTDGPIDQATGGQTAADAAGFVAFDLYIKSGFAQEQNLYFNQSEFKYNENNSKGTPDKHAISALRVAFANYGNATDAAAAKALSSFVDAVVYEPASTVASDGSTKSAGTTYYVNGVGTGLTKEAKTFASSNSVIVASGAREVADSDANNQYITVQPGINKFRVYIWVEGNDIDCIDDIASDELSATFRFLTTVDATPQIP
ncbi:MAG: hypothetical protein IJS17_00915, partial [Clostridia bacterium]|nr:hypothetical protein [Clostridia bacterium]